uniref:Arsenite methyltransferase n=1 Tax=Chlamydomonas leiostraca TaxID=1034604 RepID=A0A7S0WXY5_9CHLO|mmetsp:Transcript_34626/g.87614  ORF Transcript_34626/g.87614 Transcript_34626/m.87614 type:complete len:397 (+) Transcript_34626:173-1363(+)
MSGCCPGVQVGGAGKSCCPAAPKTAEAAPMGELLQGQHLGSDHDAVKASVQQYYGQELHSSSDLKTAACTSCKAPPPEIRAHLKDVPQEIKDRFYGCGTPLPLGITGLRVLDLGCGTGRDCYVAARLVGESGSVTGVDMTPEQLAVARKYVDSYTAQVLRYAKPNMRFVQGTIEKLEGIADASQDLIISNCVINLSPDKASVLREAYRVLAPGGEMYFSDVYCDRRLPKELRTHPVLLGECLGGALYINDFLRLAREVGFTDPRSLEAEPIAINDAELAGAVGEAKFFSITYRLFKIPGRLETLCEDYGQVAVYKGTLPGHKHAYALDDHHRFIANKPMLVCGNTASMVEETWLKPHFIVTGNRDVHYGQFDCGTPVTLSSQPAGGAACAPGGACC